MMVFSMMPPRLLEFFAKLTMGRAQMTPAVRIKGSSTAGTATGAARAGPTSPLKAQIAVGSPSKEPTAGVVPTDSKLATNIRAGSGWLDRGISTASSMHEVKDIPL